MIKKIPIRSKDTKFSTAVLYLSRDLDMCTRSRACESHDKTKFLLTSIRFLFRGADDATIYEIVSPRVFTEYPVLLLWPWKNRTFENTSVRSRHAVLERGVDVSGSLRLGSCGGCLPGLQATKTVYSSTAHPWQFRVCSGHLLAAAGDLAHSDRTGAGTRIYQISNVRSNT